MLLGNQAPDFSGSTWQQALPPWLILGPGLHHQLSPSTQRSGLSLLIALDLSQWVTIFPRKVEPECRP